MVSQSHRHWQNRELAFLIQSHRKLYILMTFMPSVFVYTCKPCGT